MSVRPLTDVSAAAWFVEAEADWWTKVCLGPPGHDAYARLELVPAEVTADGDLGAVTVGALRRILPAHTTTADDCYFGQWEGCGWEPPVPPVPTTVGLRGDVGSGVVDIVRAYWLFAGRVTDLDAWDGGDPPHLMWPADHAWFVAKDVDPDWIGLGGTQAMVEEVLSASGLDAARCSYDATDWRSR